MPRFFPVQAGPHIFLGLPFKMKPQLLVQLRLNRLAPEQRPQAKPQVLEHLSPLSRPQHLRHRGRQLVPRLFLHFQLTPPGLREFVVFRSPVVFRRSPARLDPPAPLQPVQRRIQRALLHAQHVARNLLDALGNGPAMLRLQCQRSQNQQIQSSLRKINPRHVKPPLSLLQGPRYHSSCRSTRGKCCPENNSGLDQHGKFEGSRRISLGGLACLSGKRLTFLYTRPLRRLETSLTSIEECPYLKGKPGSSSKFSQEATCPTKRTSLRVSLTSRSSSSSCAAS